MLELFLFLGSAHLFTVDRSIVHSTDHAKFRYVVIFRQSCMYSEINTFKFIYF
jgi:hypothetical protein